MDRWLGRYSELAYAAFRIVAGFLFACHGAQKLFGVLGGTVATSPLRLTAGVIELVGGLMIAAGALASWAAFVSSGEMAFAYFMVHARRRGSGRSSTRASWRRSTASVSSTSPRAAPGRTASMRCRGAGADARDRRQARMHGGRIAAPPSATTAAPPARLSSWRCDPSR
jgi:uncharacterized membrane protein YphA (DoxX/SURF4 family)